MFSSLEEILSIAERRKNHSDRSKTIEQLDGSNMQKWRKRTKEDRRVDESLFIAISYPRAVNIFRMRNRETSWPRSKWGEERLERGLVVPPHDRYLLENDQETSPATSNDRTRGLTFIMLAMSPGMASP